MDWVAFFTWLWIAVMYIIIAVIWYYLFLPCICGLLVDLWYAVGFPRFFYRFTPDEFRIYPRDVYNPEFHEPLYMCYFNSSVCLYMGWHFWARNTKKLRDYYRKRFGDSSTTTRAEWRSDSSDATTTTTTTTTSTTSRSLYQPLLPMTRAITTMTSITAKIKRIVTASSYNRGNTTAATESHVLIDMDEFADDETYDNFATDSTDDLLENDNANAQRDEATVPLLQQQQQ